MYNITNIRWANQGHTILNFDKEYTASGALINAFLGEQDLQPGAVQLWNSILSGEYGPVYEWDPQICNLDSIIVPPPPPPPPPIIP